MGLNITLFQTHPSPAPFLDEKAIWEGNHRVWSGKHRAEDTDEVGLICASLPFVWGVHNKRELFLAMDWHCITRYTYWPDKERDSGAPAPNKHCGVICSKAHRPQEGKPRRTILTRKNSLTRRWKVSGLFCLPGYHWRNNTPRVLFFRNGASLGCHFKGVYGGGKLSWSGNYTKHPAPWVRTQLTIYSQEGRHHGRPPHQLRLSGTPW